jgi:Tfp pilus assembly protein PilV
MSVSSKPLKATNRATRSTGDSGGFSLLELMLAVFLLMVITGAIFQQLIAMQRKSVAESMKVDVTQQAREFVDGMVHDLHMAGYPKASMYSTGLDNTSAQVAAGLVSVSPTSMIYEGDVNSEGVVYSVSVQYVANDPNDPTCPCVRRSAVQKVAGSPLAQGVAPFYWEVSRVVPPGIGPGASGLDLFEFFDQNGKKVPINGEVTIANDPNLYLPQIRTVRVNLSLSTGTPSPGREEVAQTSFSATARLDQ